MHYWWCYLCGSSCYTVTNTLRWNWRWKWELHSCMHVRLSWYCWLYSFRKNSTFRNIFWRWEGIEEFCADMLGWRSRTTTTTVLVVKSNDNPHLFSLLVPITLPLHIPLNVETFHHLEAQAPSCSKNFRLYIISVWYSCEDKGRLTYTSKTFFFFFFGKNIYI